MGAHYPIPRNSLSLTLAPTPTPAPAYQDPDTCQSSYPPLLNIMGVVPYVVVSNLDLTGHQSVARTLHFVLCMLDPPYAICGALYYVFRLKLISETTLVAGSLETSDYLRMENNVLPTLLVIWSEIVFFAVLLFVIDSGRLARLRSKLRSCLHMGPARLPPRRDTAQQDVDVSDEAARVKSSVLQGGLTDSIIQILELEKSFTMHESEGGLCTPNKLKRAVDGVRLNLNAYCPVLCVLFVDLSGVLYWI